MGALVAYLHEQASPALTWLSVSLRSSEDPEAWRAAREQAEAIAVRRGIDLDVDDDDEVGFRSDTDALTSADIRQLGGRVGTRRCGGGKRDGRRPDTEHTVQPKTRFDTQFNESREHDDARTERFAAHEPTSGVQGRSVHCSASARSSASMRRTRADERVDVVLAVASVAALDWMGQRGSNAVGATH